MILKEIDMRAFAFGASGARLVGQVSGRRLGLIRSLKFTRQWRGRVSRIVDFWVFA